MVAMKEAARDVEQGRAPTREELQAKLRSVESTLGQIQKKFGSGSIMRLGTKNRSDVRVISTGSLSLDWALGVGGFPRGRIIEVFGPESSGKTTLALHVIANAQRADGIAAFIDAEHALDPSYARKLGVDMDHLLVSQPDCGEQALEIVEMLVTSSAIDVIVVDSVAALVPRAELEGEMGDTHVGLQARLMSQALRKLTAIINRSQTCVVFINQLREKVGVTFGNPEVTTGGRALKFYASVRLEIRRISALREGDDSVGSRARAKVVKNKVAPPFRKAEFDVMFDRGIWWAGDVLDLAAERGIVEKVGAWYAYRDTKLGQGRERAAAFLEEKPAIMSEIEAQLVSILFPPEPDPSAPAVGAANARREAGGREGTGKGDEGAEKALGKSEKKENVMSG
jgi:recombination protein RecA